MQTQLSVSQTESVFDFNNDADVQGMPCLDEIWNHRRLSVVLFLGTPANKVCRMETILHTEKLTKFPEKLGEDCLLRTVGIFTETSVLLLISRCVAQSHEKGNAIGCRMTSSHSQTTAAAVAQHLHVDEKRNDVSVVTLELQ